MGNVTFQLNPGGGSTAQTQSGAEGAADVHIASGEVSLDQAGNIVRNKVFPASSLNIKLSITSTVLTGALIPGSGSSVRIVNEGPNVCYVGVGGSAVAAAVPTTTPSQYATPVLAGEDVTFSRLPSETYISAICTSNQTASLNVSSGEGI